MANEKIPSVYGGNMATNADTIAQNYTGTAGCSQEQIMSPITIPKDPKENSPVPGFRPPAQVEDVSNGTFEEKHVGPTNKELNPYFGIGVKTDFQIAVHNDDSEDLNLQTKEYKDIDSIRTMAFRGPMLLSGWGYDLADQPILENEDSKKNGDNKLDKEVANDRSLWKTGPIDLRWDDERQVWSGGLHIVEGILTSKIDKASSPSSPTEFTVSLRRGKDWDANGETITCYNRDTSLRVSDYKNIFVIAIRINYEWRPLWVGCP
jgi:hypothetical protein